MKFVFLFTLAAFADFAPWAALIAYVLWWRQVTSLRLAWLEARP